ncbi:MAG: response regulator [Polyangiaceae bacterium]|nr:response regulator [Polyangiaceae bacterium]
MVDDDPIVLETCREWLVAAGFEVAVRDQALGTSRLISQWLPDIVLLDVMMPALGGTDLALLLKKSALTQKIHIVLHSSKPDAELSALIAQTGALGAISKNSDGEAFIAAFRSLSKQAGL